MNPPETIDERLPPSYESVLNADFGDPAPPPRAVSPPLPSIPCQPAPQSAPPVVRNPPVTLNPPVRRELSQRHSVPNITHYDRPGQRPARNGHQRPYSARAPAVDAAQQQVATVGRNRSRSDARLLRATSPGAYAHTRCHSKVDIRPHPNHTHSLPSRNPSCGRPSMNPSSPQELRDLAAYRKASFFCSSKKTAQLVRTHSLTFLAQLDAQISVDQTLDTLQEACALCNADLGNILREGRVDGHSPLYWAVVRCAPDPVLKSLLKYTPGPMDEEVRLGAIVRSDWRLYQRIRTWIGLPGKIRVDESGDGKSFVVYLQDVSPTVGVDFLARGRMWRLAFPTGSVSISLVHPSAPTFVDATFSDISKQHTVEQVSLKSTQQLQPPDRKGKTKEITAPMPLNATLQRARLDVRLTAPEEASSCIIC